MLYAPQILVLFLGRPTDNTIEIAVGFVREIGAFLQENSTKANAMAFIRFLFRIKRVQVSVIASRK